MGLLAAHLLVMGCAAESTPSPQMGRLHQAMELEPVMMGRIPDSGLGTSIAACDGPNFVAGAPGENSAYYSGDGGRWLFPPSTPDASVGLAVACGRGFIVVAGPGGVWRLPLGPGGPGSILPGIGVEAIARHGDLFLFGTPHLPGTLNPAQGGVVVQGSMVSLVWHDESEGFGSAVAWDSTGNFFAVGDPITHRAYVYPWPPDPNRAPFASVGWDAGRGSEFGAAVALGRFFSTANSPLQLIVAAPGVDQVYIFTDLKAAGGPRLAEILSPPEGLGAVDVGGFGRALALDQPLAQSPNGPQPLWVGDPMRDRVLRFIGDAGKVVDSKVQTGSWFGYSLAVTGGIEPTRKLFVGAPHHDEDGGPQGVGAVYDVAIPPLNLVGVTVAECSQDSGCSPTDTGCPRICYGGVLCVPSKACGARDSGTVPDGGTGDAGDPDSGVPDAGEVDAGQMGLDAGQMSSDGGTAVLPNASFTTCGCSGVGAGLIPLGLLFVARTRRARAGRRN